MDGDLRFSLLGVLSEPKKYKAAFSFTFIAKLKQVPANAVMSALNRI